MKYIPIFMLKFYLANWWTEITEKLEHVLENKYKIAVPLFGANMQHQMKAKQFYTN